MYNLDDTGGGIQDCPKCKHTMNYLRRHNAIQRNEGYLLDDGKENNFITYLLWGWMGVLLKFLYRHTLEPLFFKTVGEQRQRRYDAIVREYPNTLICPHCSHILRKK